MPNAAPLPPFKPQALEKIAEIIGDAYTGSEITELFRRAGFPEMVHDGSTKWRWVYSALIQIQTRPHGAHNICKVVESLADPQGHVDDPEFFAGLLPRLNKILAFYALELRHDGKLIRAGVAETTVRPAVPEDLRAFDAREFHSMVVLHSKRLFSQGNYFHAVFEACKAYDKLVASRSQVADHGTSLMGRALGLKGTLKINTSRSQSERNEQEGLMHLSMGLMNAIRNPQAHEPALDWPLSRDDALDLLSFISFLTRRVADRGVFAPVASPPSGA